MTGARGFYSRTDRATGIEMTGDGMVRKGMSTDRTWRGEQPRRNIFRGLAAVLLVAGCAPGADLPPLPPAPPGAYRLGAGDQVRVITFGGDQLTGEFRISDSGSIAVPLLGPIRAAGLSTTELGNRIAAELEQRKLINHPSVSVEVMSYRPFFILGEVSKPGRYPYEPGMTLLTAVSIAGGFTYRAVTRYASVVRNGGGSPIEGKVDRQTLVQPGDVITIFERRF